MKLPSNRQQEAVVRLVSNNLLRVICGHNLERCHGNDGQVGGGGASFAVGAKMMYVSSLLENFGLGEEGLKEQLPLGKHETKKRRRSSV